MGQPHRFIDALCREHRDEILNSWWCFPGGDLDSITNTCSACARCVSSLGVSGSFWLRALPDLSSAELDHHRAVHEAAHVVVGVHVGCTVRHVYINDPAASSGVGGQVVWEDGNPTADDWLAVSWAGEASGLQWLRDHGYDTDANRLDIHYLAHGDVANTREWAQRGHPMGPSRAIAARLVHQLWPAITALANHIVDRRELAGDEVHRLLVHVGIGKAA